ncbi:MBL fold metallo-hydrolase [Chloroflexota bacterium]
MRDSLEIIPHVHQITNRGCNIILIVEEELTLIDTGLRDSSSKIVSLIHNLGRSVEEISLIIITHNHLDHVGGLPELRNLTTAKIAIHKADINEGELTYPRVVQKLLHTPSFSTFRPLVYAKSNEVDIQLNGNEVLSPLGGLKVIHTPGHTPGSISLFSPQKKLFIAGDALNNLYNIRPPLKLISTDLPQAIDSIKRIARLDFDTLCFGHGRPLAKNASAKVQGLIKKQGL